MVFNWFYCIYRNCLYMFIYCNSVISGLWWVVHRSVYKLMGSSKRPIYTLIHGSCCSTSLALVVRCGKNWPMLSRGLKVSFYDFINVACMHDDWSPTFEMFSKHCKECTRSEVELSVPLQLYMDWMNLYRFSATSRKELPPRQIFGAPELEEEIVAWMGKWSELGH